MDRVFEATIDSQGHFDIPIDMRDRHGLTNGARVKIEERPNEVVIKTVIDENERKRIARVALDRAVGFLGTDSKVLDTLLEERRKDREIEDRPIYSNGVVPKVFDKAAARQALEKAVGFMGTDGAGLKALMEERKRERER